MYFQFRYGEDGMDVCKSTFMNTKQFDFLVDNMQVLRSRVVPTNVDENDWGLKKCEKAYKKVVFFFFERFSYTLVRRKIVLSEAYYQLSLRFITFWWILSNLFEGQKMASEVWYLLDKNV